MQRVLHALEPRVYRQFRQPDRSDSLEVHRRWQAEGASPQRQSSTSSPHGEDWEREQASHKAGMAALRSDSSMLSIVDVSHSAACHSAAVLSDDHPGRWYL